jgi:release factor glutamine methyltransferase
MTVLPATLGRLHREAMAAFREAGLATPEIDARWLLAAAAKIEPQDVVLRQGEPARAEIAARLSRLVARRLGGEPVDRILGSRDFWGLPFRLGPATFSPRPDTEIVVAAALERLASSATPRILDLGTGSGAILVALLSERQEALGVGVDKSLEAVLLARANARMNGVGERALFVVGDWGAPLVGPFDLVVSNPPYVASAAMAALQPEVRDHDPHLALDGGADAMAAYRDLLPQARRLLTTSGSLVLELGEGQEAGVAAMARRAGLGVEGAARRDLGGVPRALVASRT